MARTRSKKPSPASAEPGTNSTASVFLDGTAEELAEQTEEEAEEKRKQDEALAKLAEITSEGDNDPSTYLFPFNVIYTVQDFLNDNMTTRTFVQLLVIAFTCHLMYLNNVDLVKEYYELIGFNFVGVAIATLLAYNTVYKKHIANPEGISAPEFPEFNFLHGIFIPLAFALLCEPLSLLLTLSLNYFTVTGLPLVARLVCAFMFYYVYTDESTIPFHIMQAFATYVSVNYLLEFINSGTEDESTAIPEELKEEEEELAKLPTSKIGAGKSLLPSEIHLLTLLLVKLFTTVYPRSSAVPAAENIYIPLIIFQKLLLAIIGASVVNYPAFTYYKSMDPEQIVNFTQDPRLIAGFITISFSCIFYLLSGYLLEPILDDKQPIVWLHDFIVESDERIRFLTVWASILFASVLIIFLASYNLSLNSRRKIWHSIILLVLTISQPLITQPIFTLIALGGSITVFIIVELLRYNKFTALGKLLYKQLVVFQDSKDLNGPLNCSYIFLILGISIPIVIDFYENLGLTISKYSYLGLIFLGVGDSFASIIGKTFGSIQWYGSYKTIQGTGAFMISSFAAFFAVQYFLGVQIEDWESIFITCFLSSLLEGASDMNDNFLIPCFSYVILKSLEK